MWQNPLKARILADIRAHGPMPLSQYMRLCLTHPEWGYYKSRDPLGSKGDFVTAPEVSQMFGEMIGVWISIAWQTLGCPNPFVLGELGPGRGTLMADALRALKSQPEMTRAMRLVLLETNDDLRRVQGERLADHHPAFVHEISEFAALDAPLILIANEFFDALPIRQYQFDAGHWHERLIGALGDDLVWGLSPNPIDTNALPALPAEPENGAIFEDAPLAESTMSEIAALLRRQGGAALVIDYGYTHTQTGATFQGIANHTYADPFADPGRADLTAHVDFARLVAAAQREGAASHIVGTQAQLLEGLGIAQRASALQAANPVRADSIGADLARLTGSDQMGDLFKAMVVFGKDTYPPFVRSQTLHSVPAVAHGFFGRLGGVSLAPFDSLNSSFKAKDDRANVATNRARIARTLNFAPEKLFTLRQVHSAEVLTVDEQSDPEARPEADGLVTKAPGLLLGILTADCTPILFADEQSGVIGACHAGWKGAVAGIADATVEAMIAIGARTDRIRAAIGPNISFANYEVGPDFAKAVLAEDPAAAPYLRIPDGKAREHFDLTGYLIGRLRALGITGIDNLATCTYANIGTYFSHRYATHHGVDMGRQLSVIGVK